ncbi:MAG: alpha-galactosidase [Bacteroidetes bacterium]|nr:MAG: alpha-galactosidase [Bacteroidota bacterium]
MFDVWSLQLQIDGQLYEGVSALARKGGPTIDFTQTEVAGGQRIRLVLSTQQEVRIDHCYLEGSCSSKAADWILANGFQSWSDSRWYHPTDSIPQLRRIARPLMGYYGDYHIPWIERGPAKVHSWSWTEWRPAGEEPLLIASLNERNAFTCFQWLHQLQCLRVEGDCRGHQLKGEMVLLDFVILRGELNRAYDTWTQLLDLPPLRAPQATGWTSWYQHYTNISAEIITDNLRQMVAQSAEHTFFQIDDGYQQAVGDWLNIKPSFPEGMAAMAAHIRQQGLQAGLWLAPTVADQRSDLLRKHPEWLQRNERGRPRRAGYNPMWGGWYYALNTTHPGWQAYMDEVLRTVTKEWGFSLLKLDFLFTTCLYPTPHRTRAQLMHHCLVNLNKWADDAYLLGCGTPLASGFGIFDYCRVGADIHLSWEHNLLKCLRHRERVSTVVALRSVLARAPLAGRVWRNDPDVYLLRDENIRLSREERAIVHRINALVGELLFTSDNVGAYRDWQLEEWQKQPQWIRQRVQNIEPLTSDIFRLQTSENTYLLDLKQRKLHLHSE